MGGPTLAEEVAYPFGAPWVRSPGGWARPSIQLPVLGLLLVAGLALAAGALIVAVMAEPVGRDGDNPAAVALVLGGLALTVLGMVVGVGSVTARQVRATGWTRPTPQHQIPQMDLSTPRGVAYLVAVAGFVCAVVGGTIVFADWDLSTTAIVGYGLLPLLLLVVVPVVGVGVLGRQGGRGQ